MISSLFDAGKTRGGKVLPPLALSSDYSQSRARVFKNAQSTLSCPLLEKEFTAPRAFKSCSVPTASEMFK